MGTIRLPSHLTPAVLTAVQQNLARIFAEWVIAERRKAPVSLQANLQAAYEQANVVYREAMDRAECEKVPLDGS